MNNNKGRNRIRTSEACLGTFFGTLVGIMAATLFYRLFEDKIVFLRGPIALDLGAMVGIMVGSFLARIGYRERERARRRRERRALRDWEGYKAIVREGYKNNYPFLK